VPTMSAPNPQRYWDDVNVGDAVPGFELYLSETKIVEQVSGTQNFYPGHHDREFARRSGHPDVFFDTGFTRAVLGRLMTDYVGADGWLRRLEFAMRGMNRPGVTVSARGRVTRKYVDDEGDALVDIELWLQNEVEGLTTPAQSTVMLPRR
jgi:hypothetical protein